jgi:hypothetical protein
MADDERQPLLPMYFLAFSSGMRWHLLVPLSEWRIRFVRWKGLGREGKPRPFGHVLRSREFSGSRLRPGHGGGDEEVFAL